MRSGRVLVPSTHSLHCAPLSHDTVIRRGNRHPGGTDVESALVLMRSPVTSGTATVRVEGWQAQPSSRPSRHLLEVGNHDDKTTVLVGLSARRWHRRVCPRFGSSAGRAEAGAGSSGCGGSLLEKLSQIWRFSHRQLGRDLQLLTRALEHPFAGSPCALGFPAAWRTCGWSDFLHGPQGFGSECPSTRRRPA